MIALLYATETGVVTLAQPALFKPGNLVPVMVTFDADPGALGTIQLGVSDDATPRNLLAYLDSFTRESATVYIGTLNANDSRLVAFMASLGETAVNLQLTVQLNGETEDSEDLSASVQPQMLPLSPATEGGPSFYTETETNALLAPLTPAPNQADLTPAAAVTAALFAATGFSAIHSRVLPGAGSGAFVADYTLPVAGMVPGAIAEVNVELPASANPTVNIYNSTVAGSPLSTVTNAASASAAFWYGRYRFDGAAWHCLFRAFQT